MRLHSLGFTLIEMLVVLMVTGTIVAAAAPSVGRGMAGARVRRASSIVAGDLELAFSNAARQRRPVRVMFSSGGYTVSDRATMIPMFTRSFGSEADLQLSNLSASAPILDIYPNGIASSPDTVRLQQGARTARVIVTRAGLIRGMQ